ncbi:MAG: hypothetical protein ABEJ78_11370 [Haloferacaceae archaeon]
MPSTLTRVLFSEPSGRTHAAVMFSGSLLFSCLYVYAGVLGDSPSSAWLLFMIAGTGLSGIAESLPTDRRRMAGVLRVTSILAFTSLLAITVFVPEFVVGGR